MDESGESVARTNTFQFRYKYLDDIYLYLLFETETDDSSEETDSFDLEPWALGGGLLPDLQVYE